MKYPYHVRLTQEGTETYWVARSDALKGCIGVGDTPENAVSELEENETAWLETAVECGIEIPQMPIDKPGSKKIKRFKLARRPASAAI